MIQRNGGGNKKNYAHLVGKTALKRISNRRERTKLLSALPSQCL